MDERESFWEWLRRELDFSRYRPYLVDRIESRSFAASHGEVYVVLKNPRNHRYLQVSEREFELLKSMDGEHSVKDLVLEYFRRHRTFAYARVTSLVEELRDTGFLRDEPVGLFTHIRREVRKRAPLHRLTQTLSCIMERQFAIPGIDRLVTRLYNAGMWLLFTKPAKIAYAVISLLGLYCFIGVVNGGEYSVLETAGSYALGVIVLIAFNLIVILLHEGAHAFATKSYGREVPRGGFLIYMGMPAFFVDTTDIWLEGRPRRIAVSWAGPYVEMTMGGLLAIVLYYFGGPGSTLDLVLFRIAFLFYLGVIINLNPLLELDGYYMLMDWLEVPQLRKRSFAFLRNKLWDKLCRRESFSREERIFTVYGLLAFVYTALVLVVVLVFWQTRIVGAVVDIWQTRGWVGRVVLLTLGAGLVLPVAWFVVSRVLLVARAIASWVARRRFLDSPRNLALVLAAVAVAAVAVPVLSDFDVASQLPVEGARILAFILAVVCLYAAARLIPSRLTLALFAAGGFFLTWGIHPGGGAARYAAALLLSPGLWLLTAGVIMLIGSGLRFLTISEKVLLPLAALVTIACTAWFLGPAILESGPTHDLVNPPLMILALIVWIPTFTNYLETIFRWPTLLAATGVVLLVIYSPFVGTPGPGSRFNIVGIPAGVPETMGRLGIYFLGAFWLCALQAIRHIHIARPQYARPVFQSDRERLDAAFGHMVSILLHFFEQTVGRHVTQLLVFKFNARSATITIQPDGPVHNLPETVGLNELGRLFRASLDRLTGLMKRNAGQKLVEDAIERTARALYWEEREVLTSHVLSGEKHIRNLGEHFLNTRRHYEAALLGNPIFAALSTEERRALASRLKPQQYRWGQVIIRQGEVGDRFYIIFSGEVEVVRRKDGHEESLARLGEHDFFGEIALMRDVPRTASCIAASDVRVLYLERSDFHELLRRHFKMLGKVETAAAKTTLLRNMPLFTEFSPQQLGRIISCLQTREAPAGTVVIREGDEGQAFRIIERGLLEVSVHSPEGRRVIAELRRGEYFGETSLLEDEITSATVTAAEDSVLLVLTRKDFDRLMRERLLAGDELKRVSSRRQLDLERKCGPVRRSTG